MLATHQASLLERVLAKVTRPDRDLGPSSECLAAGGSGPGCMHLTRAAAMG